MVAFHKGSPCFTNNSGSNHVSEQISETLKPGCLCNGMKTPDHEQKLHLDGTEKPGFQKTLDCHGDLPTCVAAHGSAATWMMNTFTGSPFLISLMSTVASLPFLLFTLPAGALADKVDRQKLICFINAGLAALAAGLALLGWLHLLNAYLMLVSVFFIGVGFAFSAPAWTSIVPQVGLREPNFGPWNQSCPLYRNR
jgi:hypothetical protein